VGETCSTLGKTRYSYQIPIRNPEGKKPVGESVSRWKDTIKAHLKGKWYEAVD
jgi:hypothetical protein